MPNIEELITTKSPLCETVGIAKIKYDFAHNCKAVEIVRVKHDFSLDYAQYLSFSKDVDREKTNSENRSIYFLKNGGSIEMKNEVTGIGRVVVYYNNCPRRIYEDLQKIEETICLGEAPNPIMESRFR